MPCTAQSTGQGTSSSTLRASGAIQSVLPAPHCGICSFEQPAAPLVQCRGDSPESRTKGHQSTWSPPVLLSSFAPKISDSWRRRQISTEIGGGKAAHVWLFILTCVIKSPLPPLPFLTLFHLKRKQKKTNLIFPVLLPLSCLFRPRTNYQVDKLLKPAIAL